MDIVWGGLILIAILVSCVSLYLFMSRDKGEYQKARDEIFPFVESYKKRCNGNNRFVVTVDSLQDSFREYETEVIKKVWLELIRERLIEVDPQDGEWCVR